MTHKTLEVILMEAMGRIARKEASQSDLALVYLMGEFIDTLGGPKWAKIHTPALEAKWKKMSEEYALGAV